MYGPTDGHVVARFKWLEEQMEKLIFRGAEIRYSDTRKDEGGVFVRIHMTADFTEVVREAMGWNVGTFSKGKLVPNDLCATHITLIPDEKSFRNHAIDLDITNMSDFEYFEVKDEDGNVSHEIRFIVRTPVEGAETKVANYMRFAGASAQLRVNYEGVQEVLALEQGAAKAHASAETPKKTEEPAELEISEQSLAPAMSVGGTHQRRKPRLINETVTQ